MIVKQEGEEETSWRRKKKMMKKNNTMKKADGEKHFGGCRKSERQNGDFTEDSASFKYIAKFFR